jgi:hypothetical protein
MNPKQIPASGWLFQRRRKKDKARTLIEGNRALPYHLSKAFALPGVDVFRDKHGITS